MISGLLQCKRNSNNLNEVKYGILYLDQHVFMSQIQSGFSKTRHAKKATSLETKLDSLHKDTLRLKELTLMRHLLQLLVSKPFDYFWLSRVFVDSNFTKWMLKVPSLTDT